MSTDEVATFEEDTPAHPPVKSHTRTYGHAPTNFTSPDLDDTAPSKRFTTIPTNEDHDNESIGGSPAEKFSFGWKAKIAAMGDDDSDADEDGSQRAHVTKVNDASDARASVKPQGVSSSRGTTGNDAHHNSLSTLPNSSHPFTSSSAHAPSPAQSNKESPLHSAAKPVRTKRRAIADSDEEEPGQLPTPELTLGPSSPDPPLPSDLDQSDSDMSRTKRVQRLKEKTLPEAIIRAKGKAKAKEMDVFGGGSDYDGSSRQGSEAPVEPTVGGGKRRITAKVCCNILFLLQQSMTSVIGTFEEG